MIVSKLVFKLFSLWCKTIGYFNNAILSRIVSKSLAIDGFFLQARKEAIYCYLSKLEQSFQISQLVKSLIPIAIGHLFVSIIPTTLYPASWVIFLLVYNSSLVVRYISLWFFDDIISPFLLNFRHLEYSFIQSLQILFFGFLGLFLELKQFHPFISHFVSLKYEYPDIVFFVIFELEWNLICVFQVSDLCFIYYGVLVLWLGSDGFEWQIFGLVDVEQSSLLKIKHEQSIIFEYGEILLFLPGYVVVEGIVTDVLFFDLCFEFFLSIVSLHCQFTPFIS